jgi:diguanylate cyclase (GGDEF)-like protein
MYDALTGLPSRELLKDRLEQAVIAAQRDNASLALLVVDLDRFDELIAASDAETSEFVLQQVTSRLRTALRASDTVAHLDDGNFAVLLTRTDDVGATLVARKVFIALEKPYVAPSREIVIRASIGVALVPHHGRDASALLSAAADAMLSARRESRGYAVVGDRQDDTQPRHMAMSEELREAIEDGGLLLTYQPKVDARTGRTLSVEALLYWDHPLHGFMAPQQFLPLAEQTGLVKPLTLWVLNEALRQNRVWQEEGLDIAVAVNLTTRNLHDPQLVEAVEKALTASGVEPKRLEIEVTEATIMADPIRAARVIGELHDAGIAVVIDDFGSGYSSLAHLARLPVSELKVDRLFVTDVTVNREDAMITRSCIDLGHNLGLRVVAEGVETEECWDFLRNLGCDLVQGFFISGPMPPERLSRWLHERSTPASSPTP